MHSVCLLRNFVRDAHAAGMSDVEIDALVDHLARNPMAGDEIRGTGGCRKVRWAGRGKGKSGGYRSITFYSGSSMPVFLVTVFGKGERSDLTQAERNDLRKMTKAIADEYAERVRRADTR